MRKAPMYAEQIKFLISEMKNEFDKLIGEVQECDLKEQDLLHFIEEDEKIGGVKGLKYTQKLRQNRIRRRDVKNEISDFAYFKKYIEDEARMEKVTSNLHSGINRYTTYNPRVLDRKDVFK